MMSSSELRARRKLRQRTKIRLVSGGKIRLSVHRTNQHIYAQLIDDANSVTLAHASSLSADFKKESNKGGNKDAAVVVGKLIAKQAVEKGITDVVFDRSGFLYHGRIQALADSARENGLKF
jgi:large subunit ribosomal protein L18